MGKSTKLILLFFLGVLVITWASATEPQKIYMYHLAENMYDYPGDYFWETDSWNNQTGLNWIGSTEYLSDRMDIGLYLPYRGEANGDPSPPLTFYVDVNYTSFAQLTFRDTAYGSWEVVLVNGTNNISFELPPTSEYGYTLSVFPSNESGTLSKLDVYYYNFSGNGSGSSDDPYIISNCVQLQEIKNNLTANYILGRNINCSETSSWNGGRGFEPIGSCGPGDECWNENYQYTFQGELNGNNYTVSSLYINHTGEQGVGLFAVASGVIKNIHFENLSVSGFNEVGIIGLSLNASVEMVSVFGNITGSDYTGGIIGESYKNTRVSSSLFEGNIIITGGTYNGGIIGYMEEGTISHSHFVGNITGVNYLGGMVGSQLLSIIVSSYVNANVSATNDFIGGLVGESVSSNVTNSYFEGDIWGNNNIGGIIGSFAEGDIINSYSAVDLNGLSENIGGLAGYLEGNLINSYTQGRVESREIAESIGGLVGGFYSGQINNSYSVTNVSEAGESLSKGLIGISESEVINSFWDMNSSGQNNSAAGEGKTTLEMKNISTFELWNITGAVSGEVNQNYIWNVVVGLDYPFLSWEDRVSPLILSRNVTSTKTNAIINWSTNEVANYILNYGATLSLGTNFSNSSHVLDHSKNLTELTAGTRYYYNLTNCDLENYCNTSGPYNFTTEAEETVSTEETRSGSVGQSINSAQLNLGHNLLLYRNSLARFNLGGESHKVTLKGLTSLTALVEVASSPQTKNLSIGEEWKVDLNSDSSYDLLVKLNNISSLKANITITSITQPISSGESSVETVSNETRLADSPIFSLENNSSLKWTILVIVAIIIAAVWPKLRKQFRKKRAFKRVYVGWKVND